MKNRPAALRFLAVAALPVMALFVAAVPAQAAQVGYDIIFECEFGCTTGVDAPTGMLFIDDSALTSNSTISLVLGGAGTMMVSAFNTDFDGANVLGAPALPFVVIASGEVTMVEDYQAFVSNGEFFRLQNTGEWNYGGIPPTEPASGTYTLTRKATPVIPEPHAAMLFGVGSLVVATRLRRRPRD